MSSEKKSKESNSKRRKRKANGFEQWGGYMASKMSKLNAQFEGQQLMQNVNEQKTEIFKGIAIFVNGYTKPSADELKRLMGLHGGIYHNYYYTTRTTHVVASNLPNSKMKNLKTQTVVTADWITESIKAGKLLPDQDFLLYTPEAVDKQHRLQFKKLPENKLHISTDNNPSTSHEPEISVISSNCPGKELVSFSNNETMLEPESYPTLESDVYLENSASHSESNDSDVELVSFSGGIALKPDPLLESEKGLEQSAATSHSEYKDSNDELVSFSQGISLKTDSTLESEMGFNIDLSSPNVSSKDSSTVFSTSTSNSPQKHGVAVKAGHPDFLSEFYNHSRLHHISTAGQELKRYVQYLAENNKEKHFPSRERLRNCLAQESPSSEDLLLSAGSKSKNKTQNIIMHLDMDCFFVSVGLRKHPELRGLPVAVTHSKGKRGGPQDGSDIHYEATHYANESQKKVSGLTSVKSDSNTSSSKGKISIHSKEYGSLSEIASCSYEARKAGLRNGMFLGEALRRCPDLKTIPYDFEGYSEVSKQLYNIVASYTLDIEAVSCDELYIDCTELLQDIQISPYQFASKLREEIEEKTGCTASAGLGCNMLLARLANKVAKPNGQFYVNESEIEEFVKKQKVGDIPGVGYTTSSKFKQYGVVTCADLQAWSLSKLQQEFGPKTGLSLFNRCRGKDDRVVQLHKDRKSVSAEINYGIRFETMEDAYNFINELSVEVQSRLQNIGCKGKALTLKLMARRPDAPVETAKFMGHGVCDHLSKSIILKSATDSSKIIANECCALARILNVKPQDYRGMGIQMSKLELVQEEKSATSMKKFLKQAKDQTDDSKTENLVSKNGIFCPKAIEIINKPIPEKSTIKHFLSNNSSPQKKPLFNTADYIPDQIDQSVLNALPEDLKKEVLENCCASKDSKPCEEATSSSTKQCSLNSSNLKQKNSAVSSTSKLKKYAVKRPGVKKKKPANIVPKKTERTLLDTFSAPVIENKEKSCDKPQLVQATSVKASLGGAVEVDEIRNMLKEWISSTQEPLEEDINDLRKFFLEAIDEDLCKVNVLIKYFYRLVSSSNKVWKEIYLTALSYVQQKVLQVYGSMLDACSDFPT